MKTPETTSRPGWPWKIFKSALVMLFVTSLGGTALAQGKPVLRYVVDTGSDAWVPYMTPSTAPDKPGIVVELSRMILKRAGIEGREVPIPERRAVNAYANSDVDFEWASPAWFPGNEFPETDLASVPVLPVREVLMFPKGDKQRWLMPQLIQGHKVGTIRGYTYRNSISFRRFDVSNEIDLVRMVGARQLPVAIIGELPGRYWARALNAKVGFGPVHSEGSLVIRLQGRFRKLLPRINDAILALQSEGEVNRIVAKYIGGFDLN